MKHLLRLSLVLLISLWSVAVLAQGMTPRPGGGMGRQPTPKSDKPAGPAEAAPEEEKVEDQPDLPPLPPWPGQEAKKLQLFQLKGYFRFRSDMFHNGNLGLFDPSGKLQHPYYTPLSEHPNSGASCAKRYNTKTPGGTDRDMEQDDCPASTLAGANMRLRLEPTINIGEQVRVHTQIDVFDNLSLGSTPDYGSASADTLTVPLDAFTSGSQAPPAAGQNSARAALIVKRAWAEVETPFGPLRFGRMPNHWGVGLVANDGDCMDCDYGDNVDRVSFQTTLAGYTLGMGYDFASSGPTNIGTVAGLNYYGGQAIDIEQLDDVDQLTWTAGKLEKEEVIRDKVDRGELVLQLRPLPGLAPAGLRLRKLAATTGTNYDRRRHLRRQQGHWAKMFVERHDWSIMPDLWFKLLWKKLYLEFEGVLLAGNIENAGLEADSTSNAEYSILQFGWVVRSHYRMLEGRAERRPGDRHGLGRSGRARQRRSRPPALAPAGAQQQRLTHRQRRLAARVPLQLRLPRRPDPVPRDPGHRGQRGLLQALGPVPRGGQPRCAARHHLQPGPPGHRHAGQHPNLGIEFDLDIFYRNISEEFYAGLQYGVLIPLAALDWQPTDVFGSAAADAEVAHTLQFRLMVKF